MLSKKSVRNKFIIQLVSASLALIVIFSVLLYNYIKISVYNAISNPIVEQGKMIVEQYQKNKDKNIDIKSFDAVTLFQYTEIKIIEDKERKFDIEYLFVKKDGYFYIDVFYPIKNNPPNFVSLSKDITPIINVLDNIMFDIFVVGAFTFFIIFFYALFLSRMLLVPIKTLSARIIKMNEKFLSPIDTKNFYEEFMPLGDSLNRLIDRIQSFTRYQKEFFIGIAHELKTPLAVMKTKNEVTLLKDRDLTYYQEAIKNNIKEIDEMNQMVSSILEIGRQEGDQLKEPIVFDLITFLKEKSKNFQLLAKKNSVTIKLDIKPTTYPTLAQPALVLHILQNFVQNAIKHSPENGVIIIKSTPTGDGILIEILDEGEGIDESKDLFAPFIRYGKKSGSGLGLFLAKGASQALGGTISIKNREDMKGAVASFFLPSSKPLGKIQ